MGLPSMAGSHTAWWPDHDHINRSLYPHAPAALSKLYKNAWAKILMDSYCIAKKTVTSWLSQTTLPCQALLCAGWSLEDPGSTDAPCSVMSSVKLEEASTVNASGCWWPILKEIMELVLCTCTLTSRCISGQRWHCLYIAHKEQCL